MAIKVGPNISPLLRDMYRDVCLMCWFFKMHLARLNKKLGEKELETGVKVKGFRYML
jgi:hypothetical protein